MWSLPSFLCITVFFSCFSSSDESFWFAFSSRFWFWLSIFDVSSAFSDFSVGFVVFSTLDWFWVTSSGSFSPSVSLGSSGPFFASSISFLASSVIVQINTTYNLFFQFSYTSLTQNENKSNTKIILDVHFRSINVIFVDLYRFF